MVVIPAAEFDDGLIAAHADHLGSCRCEREGLDPVILQARHHMTELARAGRGIQRDGKNTGDDTRPGFARPQFLDEDSPSVKGVAVEPAAGQFHEFPDIGISGDGDGTSGGELFVGVVVDRHRQAIPPHAGARELALSGKAVHKVPQIVFQAAVRSEAVAGIDMRIERHLHTQHAEVCFLTDDCLVDFPNFLDAFSVFDRVAGNRPQIFEPLLGAAVDPGDHRIAFVELN